MIITLLPFDVDFDKIVVTETHVAGLTDPRAIWGSTCDSFGTARWAYEQPHVEGNLLDYAIAFPTQVVLQDLRHLIREAANG